MNLIRLLNHPELLNRTTLFQLREEVARHPYFVPARLLFLQNLLLLHDADFGSELRKAALMVPDRSLLYEMVEGETRMSDYAELSEVAAVLDEATALLGNPEAAADDAYEPEPADVPAAPQPEAAEPSRRKPTTVDVLSDYGSYLESLDEEENDGADAAADAERTHRNQLLEDFLEADNPIDLEDNPTYSPDIAPEEEGKDLTNEAYFTETLARIYVKQGRYEKAIEILNKLNLVCPEKNPYFADQIRFLHKIIINENHKK